MACCLTLKKKKLINESFEEPPLQTTLPIKTISAEEVRKVNALEKNSGIKKVIAFITMLYYATLMLSKFPTR